MTSQYTTGVQFSLPTNCGLPSSSFWVQQQVTWVTNHFVPPINSGVCYYLPTHQRRIVD